MSKRTNKDIAHEWAERIAAGRAFNDDHGTNNNGTLYYIGDTIYSYGSHWPLATVVPGSSPSNLPRVFVNVGKYSMTTSHHLGAVRGALATICPNVRQIECEGPDALRAAVANASRPVETY
jgi:hypothetical protein